MSVVKSKRGISSMEFVDNAARLEEYTIRHCSKFPKRYTFTLNNEIVGYSRNVYNEVCTANELYPSTIYDYEMRMKRFKKAIAELAKMVRQLRIADEIFGIKATVLEEWMNMIDKEMRLLRGVICSDKGIIELLIKDQQRNKGSNL